jgi:hypothetical protein
MSATQDQPKETAYNQIAGHSIERLAAISDGIFAVAMTLLVLDLRNPAHELIHSEQDFLHALLALFPQFDTYLMSFLTLTIFWNGQQAQLDLFARTNRHLHLDPYVFLVCRLDYAVFHQIAGGIHQLSKRTFVLLGQRFSSRLRSLLELEICRSGEFG